MIDLSGARVKRRKPVKQKPKKVRASDQLMSAIQNHKFSGKRYVPKPLKKTEEPEDNIVSLIMQRRQVREPARV